MHGRLGVRLGMRAKIDAAVKEVKRKWNAGEIKWVYDTVQPFVRKYPKKRINFFVDALFGSKIFQKAGQRFR